MDFLSNEEIKKLSDHQLFIQKVYESRCLHPNKNDLLNCIYELQYEGLVSLIHKYWNENDATFGYQIRERFKQDFLEVSHIEALGKIEH